MPRSRAALRAVALAVTLAFPAEAAQPTEPEPEPEPSPPPGTDPPPTDDPPPPGAAAPATAVPPPAPEPVPEEEPRRSEGRILVSLYHAGFRWGISPGVVFSGGKAGFFLGLRFGYGFDLDSVIVVPGIRFAGYFVDPNVYVGMPTMRLVVPIDRFAPFVEGGAGFGHITDPSKSGMAWSAGGGFMIHFTRVAFGAEASYQAIAGTRFRGFGVGPILALGF